MKARKEIRERVRNKYVYRRASSSRNCEYYWHNNYKYCFSIGLAQCLSVLVIVIMLWYKERPENQKKKKEKMRKKEYKYIAVHSSVRNANVRYHCPKPKRTF